MRAECENPSGASLRLAASCFPRLSGNNLHVGASAWLQNNILFYFNIFFFLKKEGLIYLTALSAFTGSFTSHSSAAHSRSPMSAARWEDGGVG